MTIACSVCGSKDVQSLMSVSEVPVHCNLLWATREGALSAPKGDIRLVFCRHCGHMLNSAFSPELVEYSEQYENSLHFSPRFQQYAEALAARLIRRYDLHDKDIIEIGCGQGDFLALLCELGGNRGVGFDPSYVAKGTDEPIERISFIQDLYSERYASYGADLVCCRHVLEHIPEPVEFLSTVRRAIGDRLDTVVYFEVPNALFTLRALGIWDIIYEHCSYFSPRSLAHAFESCGFGVVEIGEAFGGQFLFVEASPVETSAGSQATRLGDYELVAGDAAAFTDSYRDKVQSWQYSLDRLARGGQRAVVWGGGSKGVTFLNTLKANSQVEYVVDINPRKEGMYVSGTGQRIMPPEFLRDYRPEVVIVMNALYGNEIQSLVDGLGLAVDYLYA